MIENVSTQLNVFHCFAHCLLPGWAFASIYVLLFLEKEAEIGGRDLETHIFMFGLIRYCINSSAPPNRRAARAPDEKYLPSPEPLTQIQNNFSELFLMMHSTKMVPLD